MQQSIIQTISVAILPLIFAITLHEAAHGYVASRLGDKTALMLGRVTLNPIKHIDWFGTVLLPILLLAFSGGIVFGWAKPVPITTRNLRSPRRDMALVALAGPLSNFLMALLWAGVAKLAMMLLAQPQLGSTGYDIGLFFVNAGRFGLMINAVLLVLNLLPLPPLDGSRVVSSLLPPRIAATYDRIEPYGLWILLALLLTGMLSRVLSPPLFAVINVIAQWFKL